MLDIVPRIVTALVFADDGLSIEINHINAAQFMMQEEELIAALREVHGDVYFTTCSIDILAGCGHPVVGTVSGYDGKVCIVRALRMMHTHMV